MDLRVHESNNFEFASSYSHAESEHILRQAADSNKENMAPAAGQALPNINYPAKTSKNNKPSSCKKTFSITPEHTLLLPLQENCNNNNTTQHDQNSKPFLNKVNRSEKEDSSIIYQTVASSPEFHSEPVTQDPEVLAFISDDEYYTVDDEDLENFTRSTTPMPASPVCYDSNDEYDPYFDAALSDGESSGLDIFDDSDVFDIYTYQRYDPYYDVSEKESTDGQLSEDVDSPPSALLVCCDEDCNPMKVDVPETFIPDPAYSTETVLGNEMGELTENHHCRMFWIFHHEVAVIILCCSLYVLIFMLADTVA